MPEIEVRIIRPDSASDASNWNRYAESRDSSAGYYGMVWMEIFREAFGHQSYPLAAMRSGRICGIMPLTLVASRLFGRFLVSLPFVNYGGALADDSASARAMLEQAARLRRELKASSVELRGASDSASELPERADKVTMRLGLNCSSEQMWKNFKDKVRNQIRKAQKNGLSCHTGGIELLDDFYRVFCVNMRDLGTPVYSRRFFSVVLNRMPKATRVISVRRNGRCIAAGITYTYGDTVQMPWASSLSAERSFCPNHALYWEAIKNACDNGFARFDFGRSTRESGPWRFKRQWGADEIPLPWQYILEPGGSPPALKVSNPKFSAAIAIWKRLPLPVANLLGPRIVRCIP